MGEGVSQTGHTPGPWTHGYADDNVAFVNAGAHCICKCDREGRSRVNQRANARLIAAAPDMLSALHEARCGIQIAMRATERSDREGYLVAKDCYDRVNAAIAKAEARS